MRKISLVLITALLSVVMATAVVAGEKSETVTLEGQIVCAKCSLNEDLKDCQNVLVVNEGEAAEHFYLTKNSVNEKFGDVCMSKKTVKVTGTVKEKKGENWLTAEKIEPVEKS
ncbi:MAG: DUF6370 family protein [Acidobacteriota bacterium]|nr:DUF6370 family protein [Acidobacteriota bacterium]